ncbi:MFS transporter [Dictyobacter sp. S3.2.2.5]|uniref:MFS transporter n=1 Tax=Dictyobacter halimunensis TaxID=3026934 RepID=A0ABQ6G4Q4_9CHLR|nr:MFS transporter [Dictyobacter sp. S3.2.2.5]
MFQGLKQGFQPFRYRDFRLLWIGQAISALGLPFQSVALIWLVLQRHGSPLDLALMLMAISVPQALITLAGGVITDRLDARTVMFWADATRMVMSGAIALLALMGVLPLWLLGLLLIVYSLATGIFNPAAGSITPHLLPSEALSGGNALMQMLNQVGNFLGAVPAGLIVAHSGPALAFALNSLSFAVAVFVTWMMAPLGRVERSESSSVFQDALQGFAYLGRTPWLLSLLLIDSCAAIAAIGPSAIGLPLLARDVLHIGASGYSLLIWSFAAGEIIGILVPLFRNPSQRRGRFFCLLQFIEGPIMIGVAFAPLLLAMLCLAVVAFLNGILLVVFLSLIQEHVSRGLLGRVMSFFMLASVGFVPLSQSLSGYIAASAGVQVLFLGAGLLMALSALGGLFVPSLRALD